MNSSFHFVPGHQKRFMEKISGLEADHIVLELEDGVADSDKDTARRNVVEFLADSAAASCFVRINSPESDEGASDLRALAALDQIPGVVLPKVEGAGDIGRLAQALDVEAPSLSVIPLFETFASLAHASEVCREPGVSGVGIGMEDLLAGTVHAPADLAELITAVKQTVVLSAKASGIIAVDTISTEISDPAAFRADCSASRGFGFDGRFVIHPNQIKVANEIYGPSAEQREWAAEVLRLSGGDEECGYQRIEGRVISGPMVKKAKTISDSQSNNL